MVLYSIAIGQAKIRINTLSKQLNQCVCGCVGVYVGVCACLNVYACKYACMHACMYVIVLVCVSV